MRLFIFSRHGESAANVAGILDSDPKHDAPLTAHGEGQALQLGQQLAHIRIDEAVCTRFRRTRQTVEHALARRRPPLRIEPDLDEVRAGALDGAPMIAYWSWKDRHANDERFPGGESLDDTARRYAHAFRRLLLAGPGVTLIVCHELALRYLLDAAAAKPAATSPEICPARPYLFDDGALRDAVARLLAHATDAASPLRVSDRAA